jgi:hypothetical protein
MTTATAAQNISFGARLSVELSTPITAPNGGYRVDRVDRVDRVRR